LGEGNLNHRNAGTTKIGLNKPRTGLRVPILRGRAALKGWVGRLYKGLRERGVNKGIYEQRVLPVRRRGEPNRRAGQKFEMNFWA